MYKLKIYFTVVIIITVSVRGFSQTQDLSNESFQLSKLSYTIPNPGTLGTGKNNSKSILYGINPANPSKLFVPRIFLHNQTGTVPENEFIFSAYYHPAIILDNINTNSGASAEGGTNGWRSSVVFRKQGKSAWQITSDRSNNGDMDFSIRQWEPAVNPQSGSTERFIIRPVYNVSQLGIGETNNSSTWQNYINGNTFHRGYLKLKSLNNTNGAAALGFETEGNGNPGNGYKTWLRLSYNRDLQISNTRTGDDIIYWTFREDGSMSNYLNDLRFRGENAQITTMNNSDSNNLRLILGANSSETLLKQNYSTTSRPFNFYIGNSKLMTLSSTDIYKLTVHGNALATVWQTSDKRFKKDINKIKTAVDKVNSLNGVSYNFKTEEYKSRKFNTGRTFGFVAQEVKEILPELVMEDDEGFFAINYSGFTPIIVEALKELNDENRTLKQELEYFKVELNELKSEMKELQEIKNGAVDSNNFVLLQNIPNPFNEDTYIRYTVPTYTTKNSLYVFDLKGSLLLEFNNLKAGEGEVIIEAGSLEAGLYLYKLISDGKEIGTKKMILSK
ncbi:tail fiber domain-containing protein [Flagellimonas sp. W118]|uniref:tail fiber domain-containing protein n=1 Tax=Flagellimonas sp. W118 TaxID=3410791 RepID=UPI003BF5FB3F